MLVAMILKHTLCVFQLRGLRTIKGREKDLCYFVCLRIDISQEIPDT